MIDDILDMLDKEIKAIRQTQIYYENGGYQTLRCIQIGFEVEPPVTDEDIEKSDNINKEIDNIFEYQKLLAKLKKQLEDTKNIIVEVEIFKNK